MADTVSSNFARKLKDKKVSDMQTVDIQKSIKDVQIKEGSGVSISGGARGS